MTNKIEWTNETWNPFSGCSKISEGCKNCYAERIARRLKGRYGYPFKNPFKVTYHPDKLDQPSKWKKPRRIFVCSMGDLFHDDVDLWIIDDIIDIMMQNDQHTYQVLTKRPDNLIKFLESATGNQIDYIGEKLWIGVTVESDKYLWRIGKLLSIPASVRFVSLEPMLGHIDLTRFLYSGDCAEWCPEGNDCLECSPGFAKMFMRKGSLIDWVICGGESGPGARPMHPDWPRTIRDQCIDAGVPFFFKQWGEYGPPQTEDQMKRFEKGKGYGGSLSISGKFINKKNGYMKLGKKKAGRLLDNQLWDQYPNVNLM